MMFNRIEFESVEAMYNAIGAVADDSTLFFNCLMLLYDKHDRITRAMNSADSEFVRTIYENHADSLKIKIARLHDLHEEAGAVSREIEKLMHKYNALIEEAQDELNND